MTPSQVQYFKRQVFSTTQMWLLNLPMAFKKLKRFTSQSAFDLQAAPLSLASYQVFVVIVLS